jgi:hypothetical protein
MAFVADARRAGRLAATLDDHATVALAAAAVELANRGGDPTRVAQALRAVCAAPVRLAGVRQRLSQMSEPIAAGLAARL